MQLSALILLLAVSQPPALPDGSDEARASIGKLQKVPDGFRVDLWAAEPMLGNPVAFSIDEKGRIYTAETYRFNRGTEEYRHRPFFLEGDLQNSTTAQRLAMYKKFADKFPGGMDFFTKYSERIRLLEDTKGVGRADKATTFADGFNEPLDGLAAGVLPRDGDVYFTCIPHLWKMRADATKGEATEKQRLLSGFGVQTAFLGHDLHGLIFGPDGKLYFSVGDRGFHVTTKEGKTLSGPRTGAVFRCDPDGANLEVIHTGLRNPQELAFDQFGNLFAADNNCDKGDHSRLVYIVEGGDSGWRMDYQTMEAPYLTGPWHAEKLWHLPHEGQPAWIVPPVGKLGAGPSGFTFTSGLGLPARYKNAFLMCNFSSSKGGGIDAFRVVPKGAGFELVDYHQFLGPGLFTDCEQGYDGKLYYSDWVQFTWDGGGTGKGRIFAAYDPAVVDDPLIREMKKLFAEGFKTRKLQQLVELLEHPDMRVRLRAQHELAARKEAATLSDIARTGKRQIGRLHAIWGLEQIARVRNFVASEENQTAIAAMLHLLKDPDAEIQAQAAKSIGTMIVPINGYQEHPAGDALVKVVREGESRPKFFAAMSLGRLGYWNAKDAVLDMLRANKNVDAYLRHAGVAALNHWFCNGGLAVVMRELNRADPDANVRLARALVLRCPNTSYTKTMPESVGYLKLLDDTDEQVVTEVARLLSDVYDWRLSLPASDSDLILTKKMQQGLFELAQMMQKPVSDLAQLSIRFTKSPQPNEALGRRIINANFRLGGDEHAKALLDIVTNPKVSVVLRGEALACLGEWATPGPRDRVIGAWRPLPPRSADGVRKLVAANLETILGSASASMQADVVKLIAKLDVKVDENVFAAWVGDAKKSTGTRVEALRVLVARDGKRVDALLNQSLADDDPQLRAAARNHVLAREPKRGVDLIQQVLRNGELVEKQSAIRALATTKQPGAEALLDDWLSRLETLMVPAGLALDILQAAKASPSKGLKSRLTLYEESLRKSGPLGPYRMTMEGGDVERGKHLFWSHATGQCIRCHKIKGEGGDVGPDLAEWAPKGNREHLLESLILPDKKITPGYGTVTLSLDSGKIVTGVLRSEDKDKVVLLTPEQKTLTIPTASIEFRSDPKSAMPAMAQVLSLEEMRDIIEYLAGFKK